MPKTKVNQDIKTEINKLYDKGLKLREIAEIVNLSISTISFQIENKRANKITEQMKKDFKVLYADGYSMAGIAGIYKVSTSSVSKNLELI